MPRQDIPHSHWPILGRALHAPPMLQKGLENGERVRLVASCGDYGCRDCDGSAMIKEKAYD